MNRFQNTFLSLLSGKYRDNRHFFPRITPNETYLVSFPRSGNTWLRGLLTSLLHGEEATPKLVTVTVPDVYRIVYEGNKHIRKPSTRPLVIKTHGPFTDIPAKVIYLVRDGRDALLSYYYFQRRKRYRKQEMSAVEFYFYNKVWPCPWHLHVMGWLDGLQTWPADRYQIVRYEDLVVSPLETLQSIAGFIGFPAGKEALERAIALNTRDRLKTISARAGKGELYYVGEDRATWQEVLIGEDLARYEALAGEALQRSGYSLLSETD